MPTQQQGKGTDARPTTAEPTNLLDRIVEQQAETASRYKPVMSIQELIEREQAVEYFVKHIMLEGIDFGIVPGTQKEATGKPGEYIAKPTLFKAGAERCCAFFGYAPKFTAQEVIEVWTDEPYGEPLFYYRFECTLTKDGHVIGSGIGSATTWETKYRYRNAERVCPKCGAAAIRREKAKANSRAEPGFYCWDRLGGCGANFPANDRAIVGQELGKVPNKDIADVTNTVLKMAQKRAYVAATLTATGLSGRFTQDLDDLPPAPGATEAAEAPAAPAPPAKQATGKHNLTFEEKLAEFKRQRARVGDDAYYSTLLRHNFGHANEVCKASIDTQRKVFRDLAALPDLADTAQEPPLEEVPSAQ